MGGWVGGSKKKFPPTSQAKKKKFIHGQLWEKNHASVGLPQKILSNCTQPIPTRSPANHTSYALLVVSKIRITESVGSWTNIYVRLILFCSMTIFYTIFINNIIILFIWDRLNQSTCIQLGMWLIEGLVTIKAGLGGRSEFVLRNLRASPLMKHLSLTEGGIKRLRRLEVCTHINNGVFF